MMKRGAIAYYRKNFREPAYIMLTGLKNGTYGWNIGLFIFTRKKVLLYSKKEWAGFTKGGNNLAVCLFGKRKLMNHKRLRSEYFFAASRHIMKTISAGYTGCCKIAVCRYRRILIIWKRILKENWPVRKRRFLLEDSGCAAG